MNPEFISFNTEKKSIDEASKKINDVYVATDNLKILGFVYFIKTKEEVEIKELYISPKYQRLGIGKILLDNVYLYNQKTKKYYLWVISKNTKAIDFYKKQGFINTNIENKIQIDQTNFFIEIRFEKTI